MRRRTLLRLALAGAVGVPLSGCWSDARGSVLLAYFSRPGENWWNGGRRDLEVGNTEVLARAIGARIDCDVHRIRADADGNVQILAKQLARMLFFFRDGE